MREKEQSMSLALQKGVPSNLDVERLVLGSVLLDDRVFVSVGAVLTAQDFSLEKHRRIFRRMAELHARGERIDRVTIANELLRYHELESCDGLSYLVSLDDGLPHILNLDAYTRIVKDKAVLRQMAFASQYLMNRCLMGEEEPDEILAGAEETLRQLGESRVRNGLVSARQIVDEYAGGINAFLDPSKRVHGLPTGFSGFDEKTNGLHGGDYMVLAARPSMGKTALALNVAHYVADKLRLTVAIFSLEMSKESLLTRLLCATARVDSQKFRVGYLNPEERRWLQAAAARLEEAPLFNRRHGWPPSDGDAREAAPGAERAGPGAGDRGLPATDDWPGTLRKSKSGDQFAISGPEGVSEGTARADTGSVAAQPGAGDQARGSPAAA